MPCVINNLETSENNNIHQNPISDLILVLVTNFNMMVHYSSISTISNDHIMVEEFDQTIECQDPFMCCR